MTVYVHAMNSSINFGQHSHVAPKLEEGVTEPPRTWAITCSAECEDRILHDVEHSARQADSVPLTPVEQGSEEIANRVATKSWGELMDALRGLAKERAGSGVA